MVFLYIVNDGCTALYYACEYQYHARYLYFDPDFHLVMKLRLNSAKLINMCKIVLFPATFMQSEKGSGHTCIVSMSLRNDQIPVIPFAL